MIFREVLSEAEGLQTFEGRIEIIRSERKVLVIAVDERSSAKSAFRVHDEVYLQTAAGEPSSLYGKVVTGSTLSMS